MPVSGESGAGDPDGLKQKKFLKVMNAEARAAVALVHRVCRECGPGGNWEGGDCGVAVSLDSVKGGASDWFAAREDARKKTGKENPLPAEIGACLPPLALIPRLPNTLAGHVAREAAAAGPCWTSGGEYPGGLDAVIQGARWIADEECRKVIVVRVEEESVLAVLLDAECRHGRCREIVSWSAGATLADFSGKMTEADRLRCWEDLAALAPGGALQSRRKNASARIVLG